MFSVYILRSKERKYLYVGLTNNIQRRFNQHQEGENSTTRAYTPFELIYQEDFETRLEARNREKFLKSGFGKEWIKNKFS